MLRIKNLCLICLLILFPMVSFSQTEVDESIIKLKSGDPLIVQNAKDYIIRRWVYVFANDPKNSFTKDYKKELIKIINDDTTVPDTVMDHNRLAQDSLQKVHQPGGIMLGDAKTAAMSLVGILKIKEAIPSLVKHINYIMPGGSAIGESPLNTPDVEYFPSALSLIMMEDTTAVPLLVNVVKKHPDELTRLLASKIVFRLEKDNYTNSSLLQAYSISTDSVERKNLGQVLGKK